LLHLVSRWTSAKMDHRIWRMSQEFQLFESHQKGGIFVIGSLNGMWEKLSEALSWALWPNHPIFWWWEVKVALRIGISHIVGCQKVSSRSKSNRIESSRWVFHFRICWCNQDDRNRNEMLHKMDFQSNVETEGFWSGSNHRWKCSVRQLK
jgi:hypothetical protein